MRLANDWQRNSTQANVWTSYAYNASLVGPRPEQVQHIVDCLDGLPANGTSSGPMTQNPLNPHDISIVRDMFVQVQHVHNNLLKLNPKKYPVYDTMDLDRGRGDFERGRAKQRGQTDVMTSRTMTPFARKRPRTPEDRFRRHEIHGARDGYNGVPRGPKEANGGDSDSRWRKHSRSPERLEGNAYPHRFKRHRDWQEHESSYHY